MRAPRSPLEGREHGWGLVCIVERLRGLLYLALGGLFLYKALEEASYDLVWSLIYVLVALEYFIEGRGGRSGGRQR